MRYFYHNPFFFLSVFFLGGKISTKIRNIWDQILHAIISHVCEGCRDENNTAQKEISFSTFVMQLFALC